LDEHIGQCTNDLDDTLLRSSHLDLGITECDFDFVFVSHMTSCLLSTAVVTLSGGADRTVPA
jgi:hypothetical protein